LHTEGVNRFTRHYPQPFSGRKILSAEKALSAARARVSHLKGIGEQRLTSNIQDPKASLGGRLGPSEAVKPTPEIPVSKVHVAAFYQGWLQSKSLGMRKSP
jgi:hypothetical protein